MGVVARPLAGAGRWRAVGVEAVDGVVAQVASVLVVATVVAAETAARIKTTLVEGVVGASDGVVAGA